MATTAKYPSAALTDFGADMAGFPELTLSGAHDASTTTFTFTSAVPAYWPTVGWFTVDTEIVSYTGKAGSTVTGCGRGAQSTISGSVAATHASGAKAGPYLTPQTMNQIIAEVIAHQSAIQAVSPNIVLNSDFSRRTVFGLAMPEVFADTSGYTVIAGVPTVASNTLTFNAANNEFAYPKVGYNASFWRDMRASATFKAVSTTGTYELKGHYVDANNFIEAWVDGTTNQLKISRLLAGTPTTTTVAITALVVNRWYWLEIEFQGSTVIAKFYTTGVTTPGTLKSASTLDATLVATYADASLVAGGITFTSNQATCQVGGIATGNGGVYVETWLPESWTVTYAGTLGGQAIGYDEVADAGPLAKQWAVRMYIPANTRYLRLDHDTPDGTVTPSVAYMGSAYIKTSGKGGTGALGTITFSGRSSALSVITTFTVDDAGETSWTRRTMGGTAMGANVRRARSTFEANPSAATATGTAYFMLPQLEQGSAATAWRGAPADDAPIVFGPLVVPITLTTTSTSLVETDSRNLAANVFLPWDATVVAEFSGNWFTSGTAVLAGMAMSVDAVNKAETFDTFSAATSNQPVGYRSVVPLAAGKHRIALLWRSVAAGTTTLRSTEQQQLTITATRGK